MVFIAFTPYDHGHDHGHITIQALDKISTIACATRYDKRDGNYLAAIRLTSPRMWLNFNEQVA
jgi:hypothetical protein|tara:strand:+ start:283 stop:471 length:189 start_codon:yes stop_codon:yes gene_type:complete